MLNLLAILINVVDVIDIDRRQQILRLNILAEDLLDIENDIIQNGSMLMFLPLGPLQKDRKHT